MIPKNEKRKRKLKKDGIATIANEIWEIFKYFAVVMFRFRLLFREIGFKWKFFSFSYEELAIISLQMKFQGPNMLLTATWKMRKFEKRYQIRFQVENVFVCTSWKLFIFMFM